MNDKCIDIFIKKNTFYLKIFARVRMFLRNSINCIKVSLQGLQVE